MTTVLKFSILSNVEKIDGRLAQLGEHLPYKQGVIGSSPIATTIFYGLVVQLVRTLACHARGRRFEPVPGRHFFIYASIAQLVEQGTENPCVTGSIPVRGTNDVSVRTFYRTERYKNQSENKIWLIFLLLKNNIKIIQKKGWCEK